MNTTLVDKPLIVQSDFSVLLEVKSSSFKMTREEISSFLEHVKSPELFYTYKITAVSLWNGFSIGMNAEEMIAILTKFSKFPIPEMISQFIIENFQNYGIFKLKPYDDNNFQVECEDELLLDDIVKSRNIAKYVKEKTTELSYLIPKAMRGVFKLDMIYLNFPVEDNAGFKTGDDFKIDLNTESGFSSRAYQDHSVDSFFGKKSKEGGAGIIVLPCGAGKTIVGLL